MPNSIFSAAMIVLSMANISAFRSAVQASPIVLQWRASAVSLLCDEAPLFSGEALSLEDAFEDAAGRSRPGSRGIGGGGGDCFLSLAGSRRGARAARLRAAPDAQARQMAREQARAPKHRAPLPARKS